MWGGTFYFYCGGGWGEEEGGGERKRSEAVSYWKPPFFLAIKPQKVNRIVLRPQDNGGSRGGKKAGQAVRDPP